MIALALAAALAATPVDPELLALFHAAFPRTEVSVRRPARPRGFDGDLVRSETVRLSLSPARFVALGGGRYALVALETDETASHVEPGAVAIAYLHYSGGDSWRVDHVWPQVVWTGGTGHAADRVEVGRAGRHLAISLVRQDDHQGSRDVRRVVIALTRGGPRYEGQPDFVIYPDKRAG